MERLLKNNKSLKFIASVSKKHFPALIIITILNSFNAFLGVYFAIAMRNVINFAVDKNYDATYRAALIFIGIIITQVLIFILVKLIASHISARLEIAFRNRVFFSVLKKEYSSVSKFHSGEIMNRLFNDVSVVSENASTLIPAVVGLFTKLIAAFFAILFVDKLFALIILAGGIITFLIARLLRGIMKKTHREVQETSGVLRSFVQESTENLLIIKAFKMEKSIEDFEEDLSEKNYKKKMRRTYFSTSTSAGFTTLLNLGYVYAVIWGAYKLLMGTIGFGYGDFTAILQLINQIQTPFAGLSGSLSKYYSAQASAERLLEFCNLPDDIAERELDVKKLYSEACGLSLCGIDFSYDKTPVFKNADAHINKGELVLISGISGIGKSTMLKLLMGVIKADSGEIYAEIKGGERVPLDASTRGMFAYVPQGNFLMSGTVRKNMQLANEAATDSEIENALKLACADFIFDLPERLDSVIGERGSGLSEGQVQRLAIARAILCGAPILLLDEATSALDEETERKVLEHIMSLDGKTCLCISHRSAAKEICNAVLYMEDGKIRRENIN